MLVILKLPLKDIAAVGGVDFLDSQLLSILDSLTVDSSAAGDGADAANLDGGAGVSAGALACCLSGSGGGSGRGCLRRSSRIGVEPQAARLMTIEAASTELTSFFIVNSLLKTQAAHLRVAQPCAVLLSKL